jgi:hypothetical protein
MSGVFIVKVTNQVMGTYIDGRCDGRKNRRIEL